MDLLERAAQVIERSQDAISEYRGAKSVRKLQVVLRNATDAAVKLRKLEAVALRDGDREALESLRRARERAEMLQADVTRSLAELRF
jgi:hypothetical protein